MKLIYALCISVAGFFASYDVAYAQAGWEATFAEQQQAQGHAWQQADPWQAQDQAWQAQSWSNPAMAQPSWHTHPYMYGWNNPARWDGPTTFCAAGDAAVWDHWSQTWQCSSLQGSTPW